jgi:hypothetical protein
MKRWNLTIKQWDFSSIQNGFMDHGDIIGATNGCWVPS